jgi:membrane protease YdiL (CAAX protease family)
VLLLAALAYAGRASSGKPDPDVLCQYGTAVSGLVSYAIMLAIVVAIAGASRELLALRRPTSWPAAGGLGFAVFVTIMIANGILNPFLHAGEEQGLTPSGWDASRAGQYAANFVVVAVVAPFVEELTYRGLGVSLWRRFGRWPAILVTALLFALSHGLVEGLPVLAIFGAGLAWLRLRTTSVYPGMAVHATFNALALVLAVAT